jgi:hypothetical protein
MSTSAFRAHVAVCTTISDWREDKEPGGVTGLMSRLRMMYDWMIQTYGPSIARDLQSSIEKEGIGSTWYTEPATPTFPSYKFQ